MRITAAEWKAGKLILTTSDPEALRFAVGFEEGDYSLLKAKQKRSLDANAYCWVLIGKLAAVMRLSKEEIYRNAIRDIGGNYETVCVQEKGYEMLKRCWEANGLGWQCEQFPSKLDGCINANLYYGSSEYDTQQMSVLIDRLVQDCKALDIEVKDENDIKSLLESWDKSAEK